MFLSVICFHYFSNPKIIANHKTVRIGINDYAEVSRWVEEQSDFFFSEVETI